MRTIYLLIRFGAVLHALDRTIDFLWIEANRQGDRPPPGWEFGAPEAYRQEIYGKFGLPAPSPRKRAYR